MRTHTTACLTVSLLLGFSLGWSAPAAAKPNIKAVEKACSPGTDPQTPGDESHAGGFHEGRKNMPQKLSGATTVSAREAKCLMDKFGKDLVVIAAMRDDKELPGAHEVDEGGSTSTDPKVQERYAAKLDELSKGDKNKPLLIYCHHTSCHLSYNSSLRAVNAGYQNIYWLREGNKGWIAAGYYLKGYEPDAQGLPGKYHEAVKNCDEVYLKYPPEEFAMLAANTPDDVELNATFQKNLEKEQEKRRSCLGRNTEKFKDYPAVHSDTARRIARSDAEVSQRHQAVRKSVEANPSAVFKSFLDEQDISLINDVVHKARSVKTLREICGTLDTSIPTTPAAVDAANQRLTTYRTCLVRVAEEHEGDDDYDIKKSNGLPAEGFQNIATVVAGTARYTCSRKKIPNCLPDASWRRVADVASQYNNQLVQAASKRLDARYADLEAAFKTMEDWLDRGNAHVARRNAEIEAENERARRQSYSSTPSYSAPVYTAPQPDYGRYGNGRRDSSTSAPGIR